MHSAPLWLRKPTLPGRAIARGEGGVQPADGIHHAQAVRPDQPDPRTRCARAPAVPAPPPGRPSLNPAEITIAPRTPAFTHSPTTLGTVAAGVTITARSTASGSSPTCVKAGIRGAIVISAGFKEHGEQGKELERQILQRIQGTGLRLIGPNCLGVMNPISGLNATFASSIARPGNVGFVSQSGALCTAILDWAQKEMVGFTRLRIGRIHARCRLGRPDRLPGG